MYLGETKNPYQLVPTQMSQNSGGTEATPQNIHFKWFCSL